MKPHFLSIICGVLCLTAILTFGCSNSQPDVKTRPYVIFVSMDGFRSEYATRGLTPWLDSIASLGKRSVMRPSFPSLTFPNHYTMATGLTPAHHGIVHNNFYAPDLDQVYVAGDPISSYNPDFYHGEPLWTTAEKQGVKTATFYWVGAHIVKEDSIRSSHRWLWQEEPHIEWYARVDSIAHMLSLPASQRPHLYMLYYYEPDKTGHECGPESAQMDSLISVLDNVMGHLYKTVQNHPLRDSIQIIITSDHGMQTVDTTKIIRPKDYLKPRWLKSQEGVIPALLYAQEGCVDSIYNALKDVEHIQVWKQEDVPARFAYSNNDRIGDIVVLPNLGYQFCNEYRYTNGAHGFDPYSSAMHVPVWTYGSLLSKQSQGVAALDSLVNVDMYPLICNLLQIKAAHNDGQLSRWKRLLQD